MLGNVLGTAAPAAEPTLDLTLGAPETVEAGDEQIQIGGPFVTAGDGATALGIGSDFGPAIPASPFFGPTGTIAFTLSYEEPEPDNRLVNRHVVTVRMEGRGFFGFYFIQQSRHLEMSYKQLPEAIRVVSPDRLEPGRAYRVAATWDGRVVCFFLDGVLIGEMAQGFPADFPPYSRLNLGPYQDGWITARPWGPLQLS